MINNEIGSIEFGKKADLVIYDCEEHGILFDNFDEILAKTVIKNGKNVNMCREMLKL
ncbi:MAG: hypothetical protein KKA79_00430 [Nanoarchaeota archaeon]|nr:hypothetical protein [Nanoarchaeota archaeon]MCG2718125.1 hypothetical protein [Nanoarchaeota archaeon]